MFNLFEMLANSQDGKGVEALARQFNLSQEQTLDALQALLPAFSQGLKRNTSDPFGVSSFLSALASGQHARYFDDTANATSPEGMATGNGILGHLFGSKDLSRAVAAQAAQATGLSQQLLQKMLPAIAAMIMGGLFRQSTSPAQGQAAGSANPLQEIIEQMMKAGGSPGARAEAPQSAGPLDNPFGKILQDMFGSGTGGQAPSGGASGSFTDNPFGKILADMLGGGRTDGQPEEAAPISQAAPDSGKRNPYGELFGSMFEAGARQRDDYQKGVESIFDQFVKGMDGRK